jgi:hypothetical protein
MLLRLQVDFACRHAASCLESVVNATHEYTDQTWQKTPTHTARLQIVAELLNDSRRLAGLNGIVVHADQHTLASLDENNTTSAL